MSKFPEHHEWVRKFTVSSPTLHRKGYTVYKVVSKVFPKNSVEATSQVVVWRRYNDFKKLYKALLHIYQGLHLKGNFPKFPKAQIFGRFEKDVIEARRQSALLILEFAAQYPVLYNSQVFARFFEGGEQLQDVTTDELLHLDPPLVPPPPEGDVRSETVQDPARSTPELLSMSSRTTDDDITEHDFSPRSTTNFEDGDGRSGSFFSEELAEFDPVLQDRHRASARGTSPYPSNAWILSAAEACSHLTDGLPTDTCDAFTFPKPFQDVDSDEFSSSAEHNRQLHVTNDNGTQEEYSEETPGNPPDLLAAPLSPLDVHSGGDNRDAEYLRVAAEIVTWAYNCEASGDFMAAFSHYKGAVATLLEGVQNDRNIARRDAVRRKTAQYLTRAEAIYSAKLVGTSENETRWVTHIPRSRDPSPRPVSYGIPVGGSLRGPIQELGVYKVIGVVGRVLLVLDTQQNATCAMKVLWKSPCPAITPMPSIVPQDIPYMVRLLKVYETDYAYFLVLQYASGGRLWDYLGTSIHGGGDSNVTSHIAECDARIQVECTSPKPSSGSPSKIPLDRVTGLSASAQSTESDLDRVPASYLALFTNEPSPQNSPAASSIRSNRSAPCIGGDEATFGPGLALEKSVKSNNDIDDLITSAELLLRNVERTLRVCDSPVANSRNGLKQETVNKEKVEEERVCAPLDKSGHGSKVERKISLPDKAAKAFERLDGALAAQRRSAPLRHLPEACVRLWAAEVAIAIMNLHRLGLFWQDLNPNNVLLSDGGHVVLTYHCQFNCVDSSPSQFALEHQYCAPEISHLGEVTAACDWWSFGALLYELFVGALLCENHPGGMTSSTQLNLPGYLSSEASDLLSKLLAYHPHLRLGYGPRGHDDIRSHRFFTPIKWAELEPK